MYIKEKEQSFIIRNTYIVKFEDKDILYNELIRRDYNIIYSNVYKIKRNNKIIKDFSRYKIIAELRISKDRMKEILEKE